LFKVGAIHACRGNVTTLGWIGPRSASLIDEGVGYGAGRLSHGYSILVLKQRLTPDDFEFEGNTLRSGGRLGLPAATWGADAARPRVHDDMLREYGRADYRRLQEGALRSVAYTGTNRIAKVLPTVGHDETLSPAVQYPMGGGGLQWRLVRDVEFFVACYIDDRAKAQTPSFSVDLMEPHGSRRYDNRAKLMNYTPSPESRAISRVSAPPAAAERRADRPGSARFRRAPGSRR
jgi:hypothetical protein